jgi:hypothetical protein
VSDRRDALEAELLLLDLEEKYTAAKVAYRESGDSKDKLAFQSARSKFVAARQSARIAEGRHEGTGVA